MLAVIAWTQIVFILGYSNSVELFVGLYLADYHKSENKILDPMVE